MPLFDFVCTACQQSFEALVRGSTPPACPACGQAMHAAKRRDAAQGKDRMHEQRKYELSHDD